MREKLIEIINGCYCVEMLYELNREKAEYCVEEIACALIAAGVELPKFNQGQDVWVTWGTTLIIQGKIIGHEKIRDYEAYQVNCTLWEKLWVNPQFIYATEAEARAAQGNKS